MKKKIVSMTFALALLAAVPVPAMADTITGEEDWKVSFDGSRMNSNFKSADIDEAVFGLLPGDSISIQLKTANASNEQTDWYLSNEILESLEDSTSVAEGGAYAYELRYVASDGSDTVLYSSQTVGGTDSTTGEGLHQAGDALGNYIFLERLDAGKSGSVYLNVELEGETQGNTYQNTLAKLQMTFATEVVAATASTAPTPGTVTTPSTSVNKVKTGDNLGLIFAVSIGALVLGIALMIVVFFYSKKRKSESTGSDVEGGAK